MKKSDTPFEGCLFWHTIGFVKEDGVERVTDGALHLKINKKFDADLGITVSKENIEEAKTKIISKLMNELDSAFKSYLLAINEK